MAQTGCPLLGLLGGTGASLRTDLQASRIKSKGDFGGQHKIHPQNRDGCGNSLSCPPNGWPGRARKTHYQDKTIWAICLTGDRAAPCRTSTVTRSCS